ncbi:hypothetical protein FQN54_008850 [Arachnomyces sp. PD_36]|nr:hypothetical protein FQN54_008850 [Arachnomyces sp. PD_36]
MEIVVDDPYKAYRSGDKVRGKVIYSPILRRRLDNVVVSFQGYTTLHSYHDYLSSTSHMLFNLHRRVYTANSNSALPCGKYEWPFEFTFPSVSEETFEPGYIFEQNPAFNYGSGHPLPPACTEEPPYPNGPAHAVNYQLRVYPTRSGKCAGPKGSPIDLLYQPLSPPGTPRCEMARYEQTLYPQQYSPKHRFFVRDMRSRPASEVKICLDLPKVIATKESFPAKMTVTVPPQYPQVRVKNLKVYLNHHSLGRMRLDPQPPSHHVPHDSKYCMASADGLFPNNSPVDLMSKEPMLASFPSSFKDVALRWWYDISVEGTIACMGAKYNIQFLNLELQVINPVEDEPEKVY